MALGKNETKTRENESGHILQELQTDSRSYLLQHTQESFYQQLYVTWTHAWSWRLLSRETLIIPETNKVVLRPTVDSGVTAAATSNDGGALGAPPPPPPNKLQLHALQHNRYNAREVSNA